MEITRTFLVIALVIEQCLSYMPDSSYLMSSNTTDLIKLGDLKEGDTIINLDYELKNRTDPIIYFARKYPKKERVMIKIIFYDTIRSLFSSLILSPEHLIFTGIQAMESMKAKEVKVGTLITQEDGNFTPVIKTTVVRLNLPVSSPVSSLGRIVVNGILVSCYENVDSHIFPHIAYSRIFGFLDRLPPFLRGYAMMDYDNKKLFVSFVETSIHWYRQVTGFKDAITDMAKDVDSVVQTVVKGTAEEPKSGEKENKNNKDL